MRWTQVDTLRTDYAELWEDANATMGDQHQELNITEDDDRTTDWISTVELK
jgi:hypothetical protein